jgi:hypothetical protein
VTSVRSPKGLVGISTEEASPGTTPSSIEDQIAHWRNYARAIIKAEGKDKDKDKKTIDYVTLARRAPLDRTTVAARLLMQLRRVEIYLSRGDQTSVAREAMLVASAVHQLAIIDNENSIVQWLQNNERLRRQSDAKRKRNHKRDVGMAEEFTRLRERKDGRSDTKLMEDIGKKRHLKPRQSIYAVKNGLKYFVQVPRVLHE